MIRWSLISFIIEPRTGSWCDPRREIFQIWLLRGYEAMRTEKFMDLEAETIFRHKGYELKKVGRWYGEVLQDGEAYPKRRKDNRTRHRKVEIISGGN